MKVNAKYLSIGIVFLLIFQLQILTPFHSDDFGFFLKGYSLETLRNVYLTWSGRLFSDFTGSLVMSIKDKNIISIINTTAFVGLIIVISRIPSNSKHSIPIFLSLFILYWIDNPSLSQTSFWIVGSANYLWTNLFVYSWVLLLFREDINKTLPMKLLITLMAFISGMTTENLSPSVLCIISMLIMYKFIRTRIIDYYLIVQATALSMGIAVLLLAPGNYLRAQACCKAFYDKPLLERILAHFPDSFLSEMMEYKVTLLAIAISLAFCLYRRINIALPVMFLIAALISNAVLFATPQTTGRVLNTGLVLCLISLSFTLNLLRNDKAFKYFLIISLIPLFALFLNSYINNYNNLKGVYEQDKIRTIMIKDGYNSVPIFYQGDVKKESDKLDIFFNGPAIGKFYNAGQDITLIDMPFDYSLLTPGKINLNDSYFKNFRRLRNVFVFEVAPSGYDLEKLKLFFRLKLRDGSVVNSDFVPVIRNYKGLIFINSWRVDIEQENIESFKIGFYDPIEGKDIKTVEHIMQN